MKTPFKAYALLGSGRLARHLKYYLQSLNLPVHLWSRDGDPLFNSFTDLDAGTRLEKTLERSSHVLLAVRDEAVTDLSLRARLDQTVVHFAGALNVPGTAAAHPLMTFGERLETLEWYRTIPFVVDQGHDFKQLLPGLTNPHYTLPSDLRAYYHALCSLAGNATFLLWRQIGDEFERTLKLPRGLLSPYLHQVVANSGRGAGLNFTGPVARGDWNVVRAHLDALSKTPDLKNAYDSYLSLARNQGREIPEGLL